MKNQKTMQPLAQLDGLRAESDEGDMFKVDTGRLALLGGKNAAHSSAVPLNFAAKELQLPPTRVLGLARLQMPPIACIGPGRLAVHTDRSSPGRGGGALKPCSRLAKRPSVGVDGCWRPPCCSAMDIKSMSSDLKSDCLSSPRDPSTLLLGLQAGRGFLRAIGSFTHLL